MASSGCAGGRGTEIEVIGVAGGDCCVDVIDVEARFEVNRLIQEGALASRARTRFFPPFFSPFYLHLQF
jgi:hypothetical protein